MREASGAAQSMSGERLDRIVDYNEARRVCGLGVFSHRLAYSLLTPSHQRCATLVGVGDDFVCTTKNAWLANACNRVNEANRRCRRRGDDCDDACAAV